MVNARLILGCGAEGGTRTPTSYLTRPSNVRVYQFRHFGISGKRFITYSERLPAMLSKSSEHLRVLPESVLASAWPPVVGPLCRIAGPSWCH